MDTSGERASELLHILELTRSCGRVRECCDVCIFILSHLSANVQSSHIEPAPAPRRHAAMRVDASVRLSVYTVTTSEMCLCACSGVYFGMYRIVRFRSGKC